MTLTYDKARRCESPFGTPVSMISWAFTSDGDGNASEETIKISGTIKRVVTNPDDDATPSADWDLTIEDPDGVDVLGGAGADRDTGGTGASEQIIPANPPVVASSLTLKVANAGASKKAVVKLYVT